MSSYSSNNIRYVDHSIVIPDVLDGFVYRDSGISDLDEDETPDILTTPDFEVSSMTERSIGGGYTVVDVVLEVDDVPGAIDYEVRIVS